MIDQAQAVAVAAGLFGGSAEVGAYPFDDGFVLWAEEPPRADPTLPPDTVGAGCVVVDRWTGAVSHWPPMPAVLVAREYTAGRRTGAGE